MENFTEISRLQVNIHGINHDLSKLYIIPDNHYVASHYKIIYIDKNDKNIKIMTTQIIHEYSIRYKIFVYPYFVDKTKEEMQNEVLVYVKDYNIFLTPEINNYGIVIKIKKINNAFFACYYLHNKHVKNLHSLQDDLYTEYFIKLNSKYIENTNKYYNYKIIDNIKSEEKIEHNLVNNDIVTVPLLDYQKSNIEWMQKIENDIKSNENNIYFNVKKSYKTFLPRFTLLNNQLIPSELLNDDIKMNLSYKYKGGFLISEMGVGKTLMALYHIYNLSLVDTYLDDFIDTTTESDLCNFFNSKRMFCNSKITQINTCKKHINSLIYRERYYVKNFTNLDNSKIIIDYKIKTNCSLVICPNHLIKQWQSEYRTKFKNHKKFSIVTTHEQYANLILSDVLFSHIIILSYEFVSSSTFTYKFNHSENEFKKFLVREQENFTSITEFNKNLLNTRLFFFTDFIFNTVFLDESHEILNMSAHNTISNFILKLNCNSLWNITGTPNSNGLNGLINLMKYNTDIISCNINSNYDLIDLFRKSKKLFRYNKKENIKINNYIHYTNFTQNERIIYDTYSQMYTDKDTLIKLCCHVDLIYGSSYTSNIKDYRTIDELKNILYNKIDSDLSPYISDNKYCNDKILKYKNMILNIYPEFDENMDYTNNPDFDLIEDLKPTYHKYLKHKERKLKNTQTIENLKSRTSFLTEIFKQIESNEEKICIICLSELKDFSITKCGHMYCEECLDGYRSYSRSYSRLDLKCPICKTVLDRQSIYYHKEYEKGATEVCEIYKLCKSSKMTEIIKFIMNKNKNNEKYIVFSQWDIVLTKLKSFLKQLNINCVTCTGSITEKNSSIKKFKESNDTNIMLLSCKNASSGINLTEANNIIFVEPIYGNKEKRDSIESQAIGRVDRIGQTKDINIYRFIMKNTIEEDCIIDVDIL